MQKPEVPEVQVELPVEVLHDIFLRLSLKDNLRCMQVCKKWKATLSEKYFWKMYIQKQFDLGINSDLTGEGPMKAWSGKRWSKEEPGSFWLAGFPENREDSDVYIMRPFPSIWNCRVVHPYGLDPFSGDVRSLQGFYRSLEILTYMRSEASRLEMQHGIQCPVYKDRYEICAVIFPWDKKELPTPLELQRDVFNFHPLIYKDYTENTELNVGEFREDKIYFHVRSKNKKDEDHGHREFEIQCLNSIFGMRFPSKDRQWTYEESRKFYEWLQSIMCPSVAIFVGRNKFYPLGIFLLTQLAPGWVGGALTGAMLFHPC